MQDPTVPLFIPLMTLIIPGGWRLLSLYQKKSGGKKSTLQPLFFFPPNEPTYLFQVSYVVQQDIYHLSLKHLPLGHSVCSEISQKVHFHFFPCMRDCFKHQFQFAPLQPPGVQEMWDTIELTPHGDSSQSGSCPLTVHGFIPWGTFPPTFCVFWHSFIKFKFRIYLSLVAVLLWTCSLTGW